MERLLDGLNDQLVHHFERGRHNSRGDDHRHGARRGVGVGKRGEERAMILGLAHQLERCARDDSRGAFRADDCADQIVAASLFDGPPSSTTSPSGRTSSSAEHVIGGHAVFQGVRTAGIFRDVAADRARHLRRRIGRVEISFRLDGVGDVQIDDAALGHDAPIVEIDFDDAVHLRSADHRGRVQRKASAGESGARAARHESNTAAMERGEDGAQLRGRAREQQHVGRRFSRRSIRRTRKLSARLRARRSRRRQEFREARREVCGRWYSLLLRRAIPDPQHSTTSSAFAVDPCAVIIARFDLFSGKRYRVGLPFPAQFKEKRRWRIHFQNSGLRRGFCSVRGRRT